MPKGKSFTVASMKYKDPYTKRIIHRLTDLKGNDQLLYFTSNSLTADDQTLVFLSDRNEGHCNLFSLNLRTGQAIQLTDNRQGIMESHRFFDPNREGIIESSPSLCSRTGDLYYIQAYEVRRVNVYTLEESIIGALPADQVTGCTHVSADNRYLCIPMISCKVFRGLDPNNWRDICSRAEKEEVHTTIRRFRTDGSGEETLWKEPSWVVHTQFCPHNSQFILINHQGCPKEGITRMWLWDGSSIRRLRQESFSEEAHPRLADDWVCHEMWQRDGQAIIYHGRYVDGTNFIGRVDLSGKKNIELAFPKHFTRYGHFTPGKNPMQLVTDGYIEVDSMKLPDNQMGGWISLIRADWDKHKLSWTPLCFHGSSWRTQNAHPHPIFSHADDKILFVSDRDGYRAIYMVKISD